ncbi:DUF4271 domain-containing protein [Lewinella sp. JB7]|uniref:DUF4271 domain-containing protein n=1 Tax=Lewinella sp. JB7 TaxID=2962887 RepID=UPI0020C951B4|nr:DUF4271 domain-containing protein [Lewinella sp. JB7]MCP9234352.1 DUF4271 domain-containing protein [Lewinella sp. JB7]
MRYLLLTLWLIVMASTGAWGQSGSNPFDRTDRVAAAAQLPARDSAVNPFDVRRGAAGAAAERTRPPAAVQPPAREAPPGGGGVIFIHLLLLLTMASLYVLFRGLLRQCVAAIFNDSIMTQLYRRRSGGQVGALWLCYGFFLLSAGFYLYLFAAEYSVDLGLGIWGSWLTYSLIVAAAVGLKFVVLLLLGRIYPLRKELSRYAFALMVFSILTGLLLVPVNLLISYAPVPWRPYFLYGGLGILVLVYLLHLLRGLFIANQYVGSRPLHFLLYICTIEIAPLLLVYHYLNNTLI